MSIHHTVSSPLLTADIILTAIGGGIALASMIGFCAGRYVQQKISTLALFAGLAILFGYAALMTGEGSDIVHGGRVDWGVYALATVVFTLVAGISTTFMIYYDDPKTVTIGLEFATGVGLVIASVASQYGSGKIVAIIATGVIQILAYYLAVLNMVRFDVQGWIYAAGVVILKSAIILFAALSRDIFQVDGYTRELGTYLFGGALCAYVIFTSVYAWIFGEMYRQYAQRHNLPIADTADGAADGMPIRVLPFGGPSSVGHTLL